MGFGGGSSFLTRKWNSIAYRKLQRQRNTKQRAGCAETERMTREPQMQIRNAWEFTCPCPKPNRADNRGRITQSFLAHSVVSLGRRIWPVPEAKRTRASR